MRARPLAGLADALRLRQFLVDTYTLTMREFNWEIRRWEGTFWTVPPARLADPSWGAGVQVWEAPDGAIIAAGIPDGPGDLALQVDPRHRWLEDHVLDWAEAHLARTDEDGSRVLETWAFDWDTDRRDRLIARGYAHVPERFWQFRRRPASLPVPDRLCPSGYLVRSVDVSSRDASAWIAATNAVFGHATSVQEYTSFLGSPSFDPELHIVVESAEGSFAAFAGFTVDVANRTATLEPVGTLSDHRRLGLAQLAICEGLRRVAGRGVDVVHVANWGSAAAGQLYASAGFEHYATHVAWRRVLPR